MKILIFMHVLGAVLFLGNVTTAVFWKLSSERGRDRAHLRRVARGIMLADYFFTLPGVILLIATGHIMASMNGYPLDELNWMTASEILLVLSGLIWAAVLVPAQRIMIRESANAASEDSGTLSSAYWKASRRWDVFGTIVLILPFIALYFMLVKPF